MAIPKANSFIVKSHAAIRDDILRTIRNGLIQAGISNPDVAPGSEHYIKANALAIEAAIAHNNISVLANQMMPDTATGQYLERLASVRGLSRREATGSDGHIALASSGLVTLTDEVLIDAAGNRYQVSLPGSYANASDVPISAIDTGSATNLAIGAVLRWVDPPGLASSQALVSIALTNGSEEETDSELRARLLERISNPPGSGNASQINGWAESSGKIQKSFCYPSANGPGTVHVAVTRSPTLVDKDRDVSALILANDVEPAILAELPEYVSLLVQTVANQPVDCALGLSLEKATSASPPGRGGGWLNGNPFPTYATDGYVKVQSVTSSTQFTLENFDLDPEVNVSKLCWLDQSTWTVKHATVTAYTASYLDLTIDEPFTGIAAGDFVFPDAVLMDSYVALLLSYFANMGPGPKCTDSTYPEVAFRNIYLGNLPRAFRRPETTQSYPYALGNDVSRFISDETGSELLDVQWLFRSQSAPDVSLTITDAPSILVPRKLGIYPIS